MTLLQIKSTPIGPSLPRSATLLFNRPARDLLPKFCRPPVVFNNDKNKHATLIKKQSHGSISTDPCKNILFLPTGSTVAVQHEDGELWTYETVIWHRFDVPHWGCYRMRVSNTGCIITRTNKHVKTMLITVEEYLKMKWLRRTKC